MGIKRLFFVFVLALVAAGCGGGGEEDVAATTVPLTVPSTSSTSSTTTTTTTTTTEAPETTTSVEDEVEVETADTSEIELTWADEGTLEADVEQAFWVARPSRLEIYTEDILDRDYEPFTSTHTGRDLERITTEVVNWKSMGWSMRYPEPSETLIEFIVPVTETEALMQVCELNRGEVWIDGSLDDDADIDSQFQARFVLVDGVWLWEETIKLKFEPLEGDRPTCMLELVS